MKNNKDMLLYIAIGDAYGAGFEFKDPEYISANNDLTKYHSHNLDQIPAGNYTDDTQMSLAIAELLLLETYWTKEKIAKKFLSCFKRDVRKGYAKGFQNFLTTVKTEFEFLAKIKNNSKRNGAAMRSAPIGYIEEIPELLLKAKKQAKVTHNTEIGIKSSQAIALASHFFIYNKGSKNNLTEFVSQHTSFKWKDWNNHVACCGFETTCAILTILKNYDNLKEILIKSISLGGDTDSVAALCLGVASQSEQFESNLPDFLFEELENKEYGKDYLIFISNLLHEVFEI